MPVDVKEELGENNDEFCEYWTGRFPKLLLHTWNVMKKCTSSDQFREFYQKEREDRSQISSDSRSITLTTTTTCTQQNIMQENEVQTIPEVSPRVSASVSTLAAKETVAQRLQRLSLKKASSTTGRPVSIQPSPGTVNVTADSPTVSPNASIQERENDVKPAPDVTFGELAARGEIAAEVQRGEDPEDKGVLRAGPDHLNRAERVVLTELYVKKVCTSSVKIVASNPGFSGEAAVALKDGSVIFCPLRNEVVTIQAPTGCTSSTSALVWNGTGTWIAAGDKSGRVLLWNRKTRVTKTANFPKMQVISMQWCKFEENDVIQVVFHNKFCAMNMATLPVGEFDFLQNCSMCSDWRGDDRFAVAVTKTYSINLYQVNLHGDQPLTLLTTLPGFEVYVSSIRWNPADPNWIAVGYKIGLIRVWNNLEQSTSQFAEFHASSAEVHGIEWMNTGAGNPEMLASCSKDNTVRIFTRRSYWECAKTILFRQYVPRIKYCPLAKALFGSSFNKELRMINAKLEESAIHTASSPLWDFDLSCMEERKFYAVIGDKDGCVTYVGMEIQY